MQTIITNHKFQRIVRRIEYPLGAVIMSTIDDELLVSSVLNNSLILDFPAELNFTAAFQAPCKGVGCFVDELYYQSKLRGIAG